MCILRSFLTAFGQALFALVLASTVLAQSTVGEAIVLHRHGAFRAHLHVLGFGDLLSNAASSPRFGHLPGSSPGPGSISQGTVVIAIIGTGSVFVSDPRSGGDDNDLSALQSLVSSAAQPAPPPIPLGADFSHPTIHANATASTVILLRNHALLI